MLKVFFFHVGNRAAQHVTLENRARFEQLEDFVGRKSGDDRAAVRDDGDESFGGEMAQRLANGNPADLKFRGDGVLPQLFSFPQLAGKYFFPEPLDYSSGKGLPGDG